MSIHRPYALPVKGVLEVIYTVGWDVKPYTFNNQFASLEFENFSEINTVGVCYRARLPVFDSVSLRFKSLSLSHYCRQPRAN